MASTSITACVGLWRWCGYSLLSAAARTMHLLRTNGASGVARDELGARLGRRAGHLLFYIANLFDLRFVALVGTVHGADIGLHGMLARGWRAATKKIQCD